MLLRCMFRRLLEAIPVLAVLATFTFFLLRLAPGGPFDSEQAWPPEIQATIRRQYELDRPVTIQYIHWVQKLVRGDLSESFQYRGKAVTEIIAESLPQSGALGIGALLFALLLGIPLGCVSAWRKGSWMDRSSNLLAMVGISLPSYLIASLLILIFSMKLGWLPAALWEGPLSMCLPVIALGWRPLGIVIRMTKHSMSEALSSDYARTAYGKGLSEAAVLFKHSLKNSLIPVTTIIGPVAANLIAGSFLVEVVFQIPGMGKHFVHAVLNRDYPLVMGVTLVYGVILITCSCIVDVICLWADPRMRM